MADNLKLALKCVYSKSSDYSDPVVSYNPNSFTLTPDEFLHTEADAGTGGITVTTSHIGTATLLVVKNNDTTINVTARFNTAGDSNVDVILTPGSFLVTPDFTSSGNLLLTSASGTPECEVMVVGT